MEEEKINRYKSDLIWFYRERGLERYCNLEEALTMPEFQELKMAYSNLKIAELAVEKSIENLEQ